MAWKQKPAEDVEPIPAHEWGCLVLGAAALLVIIAAVFLA